MSVEVYEVRQHAAIGKSAHEIADLVGCSVENIWRMKRAHNIEMIESRVKKRPSKAKLEALCYLPVNAIAAELNTSKNTVYVWLKLYGLSAAKYRKTKRPCCNELAALRDQTHAQIADLYDVHATTVAGWFRDCGLKTVRAAAVKHRQACAKTALVLVEPERPKAIPKDLIPAMITDTEAAAMVANYRQVHRRVIDGTVVVKGLTPDNRWVTMPIGQPVPKIKMVIRKPVKFTASIAAINARLGAQQHG